MSEPIDTVTARELIGSISTLTERVERLAELPAQVGGLTQATVSLRRRARQNRTLIIVTIVGLLLDGGVSVLFWRQHVQQDCLSQLRVTAAAIAESDSKNVDAFFAAVVHVKGPTEFQLAYHHYLEVRNNNDVARKHLGSANTSTCPLL